MLPVLQHARRDAVAAEPAAGHCEAVGRDRGHGAVAGSAGAAASPTAWRLSLLPFHLGKIARPLLRMPRQHHSKAKALRPMVCLAWLVFRFAE